MPICLIPRVMHLFCKGKSFLVLAILLFVLSLPSCTGLPPQAQTPYLTPAIDTTLPAVKTIDEPEALSLVPSATNDISNKSFGADEGAAEYPAFAFSTRFPESELVLVDSKGEVFHRYRFEDQSWSVAKISPGPSPCQLLLNVKTPADRRLVLFDLRTNQPRTLFLSEEWIENYSLSPKGDWISYTSFSGAQYYAGAEFQDVVLVSTTTPTDLMVVTNHGGALSPATWSPDGDRLAFSDFNDGGLQELLVFDAANQSQQVIHTSEVEKTRFGPTVWSPDGKQIGFVVYRDYDIENANFQPELWVKDLDEDSQKQVSLPDGITFIQSLDAWSEVGNRLLLTYLDEQGGGLLWIDMNRNQVEHQLDTNHEFLGPGFHFPMRSDLSEIGLIFANEFYSYNLQTEEYRQIAQLPVDQNVELLDLTPLFWSQGDCQE